MTVIAFLAAGFLFGVDVAALLRAWRGRSSPDSKPEVKPSDDPAA